MNDQEVGESLGPIDKPGRLTLLLEWLARGFIDTFGITHPKPREEKRAAYFIVSVLILGLGLIAFVFFVVVRRM
ncbi:hypothetical protein [Acidicapsa ligni]|uniref:hypothetical protein n=1 Tax=Acidicapsa ligni TaxID=542300 RepID=UPI0021E0459B|nr:hypothetical protein [Acidicapsa ligni]